MDSTSTKGERKPVGFGRNNPLSKPGSHKGQDREHLNASPGTIFSGVGNLGISVSPDLSPRQRITPGPVTQQGKSSGRSQATS